MIWSSKTKNKWITKKSKNPYRLRVRLSFTHLEPVIDYTEDQIYDEGGPWEIVESAYDMATDKAKLIRTTGMHCDGIHYPAHRIFEVKVIPCEWDISIDLVEVKNAATPHKDTQAKVDEK